MHSIVRFAEIVQNIASMEASAIAEPREMPTESDGAPDAQLKELPDDEVPLCDTLSANEFKRIERRMRWKLDLQIVPLCLLLYFLSFLDRTNIGQARLKGLQQDVGLNTKSLHDYQVALTILYPPYILLEVPGNLLLKLIGPRIWIPSLVMLWGIVSTLQGIVTSKAGLYADRFFLGLTEAGILPGIAVYLTLFYKPREIQLRQALFFTGASLSGAFSGLLGAAISKMQGVGGRPGWSWIFILEGIFTVLVGAACLFLLPNSVDKCWGLSRIERRMARERLEYSANRYRPRPELHEKFDKEATEAEKDPRLTDTPQPDTESAKAPMSTQWLRETKRAFTDPFLLLLCGLGFCCAISVYSVAYFSPSIVQEMGSYSATKAQLMSCPPFAASFVYCALIAFMSDRLQQRWITALPGAVLSTIGSAVILGAERGEVRYGGLFLLTAGCYSIPPALFAWIGNNTSGEYKRATGMALLIVFTNCAGLTSSWLFNQNEAPRYTRGAATLLALSALGIVFVLVIEAMILWERRMRDSGRRDVRVLELRRNNRWDRDEIRHYLGDRHPEYFLEV